MLRSAPSSRHCLTTENDVVRLHRLLGEPRSGASQVIDSYDFDAAITAASWAPAGEKQETFAVGLSTGAVEVIQPFRQESGPRRLWRIPARQQRTCTDVRINRSGHLAVGLEKVRNDPSLLLYDLETRNTIAQFATSEAVSSCVFFPDAPHLLLAGLGYRWLRLFDTRLDPRESTAVSIPTKHVGTLAIDSADPTYFASSFSDQICLWDRRSATNSADLSLVSKGGRVKELGFCPGQRLHLASLSDSGEFDLWRLHEVFAESKSQQKPKSGRSGTDTALGVAKHDVRRPDSSVAGFDFALHSSSLMPWDLVTTDGKTIKQHRIDTSPPSVLIGSRGDVLTLRSGVPAAQTSALRGLTMSDANDARAEVDSQHTASSDTDADDASTKLGRPYLRSHHSNEDNDSAADAQETDMRSIKGALANDIAGTMYKRALLNYGMDGERNAELIVDRALQTIWRWIAFSSQKAEKLRSGEFCFAFEGTLNILRSIAGYARAPTQAATSAGGSAEKARQAVRNVADNFSLPMKDHSDSAYRRKLALVVMGWTSETHSLAKAGKLDKAAFYTLVNHGDVQGAVDVLSKGASVLRIMAAALAGYLGSERDSSQHNLWREQCKRLSTELDSPYIRALFAFVSNGDWRDVLDEQGLSLRERLAVAISYLRDEDLISTLQDISKVEMAEGDLEGLLLLGITRSVDLLQHYLDRTGDVQTVALIASYRGSLHEDKRVQQWVAEYRGLLNRWGMFHARCRFDQQRNAIGRSVLRPPARQVFMRCNHCNANIVHKPVSDRQSHHAGAGNHMRSVTGNNQNSAQVKSSQCPSCRRMLPRCALCLLPLGGVVPSGKVIEISSAASSPVLDGRAHGTATGTASGTGTGNGSGSAQTNAQTIQVDNWVNFCLTCHHGLHATHAEEWFADHVVCPVPECECRCMSRDVLYR